MESENCVETVNRCETPSCLSTDNRILHSNDDECKQILEEVDKINSSVHLGSIPHTTIIAESPDSIPDVYNFPAEPLQTTDKTMCKIRDPTDFYMTGLSQDIREDLNCKAVSEDVRTHVKKLLGLDSNEIGDETSQSDDLQGSPNANVSSNEDSSEIPIAEVLDDSSSFDARRTRRKSKRKLDGDFCCPVCGLTVREPELTTHYAQEVERLTKISGNSKLRSRRSDGINTTYVQVKSNRENRLTAKVAKYTDKINKEVQCPICKLRLSGAEDDVNRHVVYCAQHEEDYDEHIIVDDDDEDDESYEEYEFADQTRIRTISLVSGGHRSLEGPSSKKRNCDAENEDLEIDVESMTYGEPQYTELDVISHNPDGASDELRKAVAGNRSAQPVVLESRKWRDITDTKPLTDISRFEILSSSSTDPLPSSDSPNEQEPNGSNLKEKIETVDQTVDSLKEKIMELEDPNKNVKCLICLETYTKPVVSTTCWHVYCEECWLMTLGVKKLCPTCNMIVFPQDLRKIYL